MAETLSTPGPSQHPQVSIVLPTHNRASRLPRALRSCLQQTYRNLEVIVVDDSTDNTPEVVRGFQRDDPRVRYVRVENETLPGALNAGFRVSKGEFLTWICDDNWFYEDAIEVMLKALEENPEVGLVYSDYDHVDSEGRFIRRAYKSEPELLPYRNCVTGCYLYRRKVYEVIGDYDPNWLYVEDYEYWLRVSKRFKLAHIRDASLVAWEIHDQTLTTLLGARQGFLAAQVQVKYASPWWRKLHVFLNSRRDVGRFYAARGDWFRTVTACLLFPWSEPWRRWKWVDALEIVRSLLRARDPQDRAKTPLL
jgi:glycosyltransferase involved in cell wall biosynthesis